MQFLWILQMVTVVGLVGLLIYVRRRRESREAEERVAACLNVVETRTEAMERVSENYRRKMEEGLKRLNVICDKASHLVERGFGVGNYSPSHEEKELRNLRRDGRLVEKLNENSLSVIPSDAVVEEITPRDYGLLRGTAKPHHRVPEINLPCP